MILGGKSSFLTPLDDLEQAGHLTPSGYVGFLMRSLSQFWRWKAQNSWPTSLASGEHPLGYITTWQRIRKGSGHEQRGQMCMVASLYHHSPSQNWRWAQENYINLFRGQWPQWPHHLTLDTSRRFHCPSVSPLRTKLPPHEHKGDKSQPSHNRLR